MVQWQCPIFFLIARIRKNEQDRDTTVNCFTYRYNTTSQHSRYTFFLHIHLGWPQAENVSKAYHICHLVSGELYPKRSCKKPAFLECMHAGQQQLFMAQRVYYVVDGTIWSSRLALLPINNDQKTPPPYMGLQNVSLCIEVWWTKLSRNFFVIWVLPFAQ